MAILIFFRAHWFLSMFMQTFFLHRYAAHRMFALSRFAERFFYLLTFVSQGTSFLVPRAYAVLHRMHHAFSDTAQDPHSPHFFTGPLRMMWQTKLVYAALVTRNLAPAPQFGADFALARDLVGPAMESAIARLTPDVRVVAAYHLGLADAGR